MVDWSPVALTFFVQSATAHVYTSEDPATTLAELAHHGTAGTQTIRYSANTKAVELLDLTDPAIARQVGYAGGPITNHTKAIGEKAIELGYNAIKAPSVRGSGSNFAVLDDFDRILIPQMIVPVP